MSETKTAQQVNEPLTKLTSPQVAPESKEPPVKITGPLIANWAKRQLSQLTGLRSETVSRLYQDGEGWHVNVEMTELRRIPDSNDVLATYQVLYDCTGILVSYQRTRRYVRGQVGDES